MRIYADLRCLQDPEYAFRGVGRHTASILRHARTFLPGRVERVGILDEAMPALPSSHISLVDRVQPFVSPRPNAGPTVFLQTSPMTHAPDALAALLGRADVLSCAIVYDFIPLDEPRYLPTPQAHRGYLAGLYWLKMHQSFYPISHYTAGRLRDLLDVPGSSIRVTGAAVGSAFAAFDPVRIRNVGHPSRFAPGRYFFLMGGNDERKNAELALAAHARLTARLPELIGLVLAGHYTEEYQKRLLGLYKKQGGDPRHVEFTSRLSDEELTVLYHRSVATLCPSHIEGFSLPVVEAMACGSPVLASSNEAHRELVLQPDALFPSNDPAAAAAVMERAVNDSAFRKRLLAEQASIPPRFQEEEVARRLWQDVRRQLDARRAPGCLKDRSGKPRLAFLSPYPPDRSGVADYTAATLASVARHAVVDVHTTTAAPRQDRWVNRFFPLSAAPYLLGEYDRVVAVVGNSDFHIPIIDLHTRHGGACLLHDNRLADVYACMRGISGFARMAEKVLGRTVDTDEVAEWLNNPAQLPALFFDEILVKADPLMVHSRGIQAQVARRYQAQAVYLPFCCYRPFPDDDLTESSRQAARQRLGVPAEAVLIISMGIVDPVKKPWDCFWALEFLRAWGLPAQLHFVGDSRSCKTELQQFAAGLNLAEHVHLLDSWVSDQTYRDYILAADFAIQLRSHGFGGLSGAVLDCISAGLPTVTTQDMATSMEAPDYILPVPDHVSALLVAEQLANAHAAGRHRDRTPPSRIRFLREHNFDRYAVELLKVLEVAA